MQKPTQILLLIPFQARMFLRPLKILVLLVMVGLKCNNGIKCLRVPSGRSITIDYETFSDFIQTQKTGSLTFEIDFATQYNQRR